MGCGVSVPPELPYHSSSLCNGKILEPLPARNEQQVKRFECGVWSDAVPDQLRPIIQQPERYKEAIGIINAVSQTEVKFTSYWPLLLMAVGFTLLALFVCAGIPLILHLPIWISMQHPLTIVAIAFVTALDILINVLSVVNKENQRIVRELQKAIGQANSLLLEEKVLMGCRSNSKLFLVYVYLDGCRQELSGQSQDHGLFQKYIEEYSSAYACCLAKRFFPFKPISNTCHLEGALCFCQCVIRRLSMKRCCFCCRKQYSYSAPTSSGIDNPSYV